MPSVTVDQPSSTVQTPSGTGSWLIPIFLIALLVGVVIIVFCKQSWKHAVLRILMVHCKIGFLSRSKGVQSDPNTVNELQSKRGLNSYPEPTFVRPTGFIDSRYPLQAHQPASIPSLSYGSVNPCPQRDTSDLCSVFSEDSVRSLHIIYEVDHDYRRPPPDDSTCHKYADDDDLADLPQLLFTPPTFDDLASLSNPPADPLDNLLQPPSIDRYGHAVLPPRSPPPFPDQVVINSKSKSRRLFSILANNIAVEGRSDEKVEEDFIRELATALYKSDKPVEKLRSEANVVGGETKGNGRRRSSMTVKVFVPSCNDLWKFWVSKDQTLEQFTARVREKVGANVALFTHMEDMIVSEDDWSLVRAENKVIAHLV